MAYRPVFRPTNNIPYYHPVSIEFKFNSGFSVSQKQKNIVNLHEQYERLHEGEKVLEVSSKSMQDGGKQLSAFNLKKFVPSKNAYYPLECVFQSGKVFSDGGPYLDLLEKTPKEAKKDDRLQNSGRLTKFVFEGIDFPLEPKTLYYDYLYINALIENPELAEVLMEYDGFTDIEFNPGKQINCQAKSCAAYVSLRKLGLLDKVKDFESFKKLYVEEVPEENLEESNEQLINYEVGEKIEHPDYGIGEIVDVKERSLSIKFFVNEEEIIKKLGIDWCRLNIKKL